MHARHLSVGHAQKKLKTIGVFKLPGGLHAGIRAQRCYNSSSIGSRRKARLFQADISRVARRFEG